MKGLRRVEEHIGGRYAPEVYARKGQAGLTWLFLLISHPILFSVFVCGATFIAFQRNGTVALWSGIGAVLATLVVNLLLKGLFRRGRPLSGRYLTPLPFDHYSFPSAHSAISCAFAIAVGIVDAGLFVPLLVWSILVSSSRLLSEIHHPADIVVGVLEGIVMGSLIAFCSIQTIA